MIPDRKDGTKTAHVGRQWLGRYGKTDNGVVTVTTLWADERVYYPVHAEPYTPARHFAKGKSDPAFRTKLQIGLDRFRYDTPPQITAWTRHLAGIEQQLRLMDASPGMLTGGAMPEYLYRRTNGVAGLLERLIEDGCREAIDTGTERLDQAVLDNVAQPSRH